VTSSLSIVASNQKNRRKQKKAKKNRKTENTVLLSMQWMTKLG
jgi:hypothetical protein